MDQEATIKNQESQLSFREKRDFLEKKFKFRTDLKDPNSIHYEKFR
ncbi:hypothetical protein GW750_09500 [bacterium]|nr:hypothetical protein [bacterium]